MDLLAIDPPIPFLLPAPPQVIALVGCGGTGSHLAQSLARLVAHVRETHGRTIDLLLFDGDRVERRNVGRQLFSLGELGQNKAQTLAARFSAAFGLRINAIPTMATAELLGRYAPAWGRIGLLIGAVDQAAGRIALHQALQHGWHLWLDSGNHERSGQVVIGTSVRRRDLQDALKLGGICTALPAPSLVYPDLVLPPSAPARPEQACAQAMQDNVQSLMLNQMMAAIAAEYVAKLVLQQRITTFETVVDLDTLAMRSTPITAHNLAPYLPAAPRKPRKHRKEVVA